MVTSFDSLQDQITLIPKNKLMLFFSIFVILMKLDGVRALPLPKTQVVYLLNIDTRVQLDSL